MRKSSLGCTTLFIASPFFIFLLVMDGGAAYGISTQLAALTYSSVTGMITRSAVTSPMSSYHFEVRYSYEVDGKKYEGSRYRTTDWGSSSYRDFAALKARFPEGAPVQVFYSPGAPQQSVLVRGIQGFDLFLLLFLSAFHFLLFGILYAMARSGKVVPEGVPSFEKDGRLHARLASLTPLEAGLLVAGLVNLAALATVGALAGGFNAPLPVVALAWAAVLAAGILGGLRRRARWRAGDYELIIDPRRRTISLPPMFGRKRRIEVPWSRIRTLVVQARDGRDSDGKYSRTYHPLIEFVDQHGQILREPLGRGSEQGSAKTLMHWLQQRVELGTPGQ